MRDDAHIERDVKRNKNCSALGHAKTFADTYVRPHINRI